MKIQQCIVASVLGGALLGCQSLTSDIDTLYSVPDDCKSLGIVVADAFSEAEAVSSLQRQTRERGGNTLRLVEANRGEGGYNHGPNTGFEFQRHQGEAYTCPD